MEQNTIVVMLDEEISRLVEVRTILESLIVVEARVAPLLVAASAEPEPVPEKSAAAAPVVVRHVSRRGISTGRRGPRAKQAATPRPLDTAVPQAPVVVSRSALAVARPAVTAAPVSALNGTLDSWVRSFKQVSSAA